MSWIKLSELVPKFNLPASVLASLVSQHGNITTIPFLGKDLKIIPYSSDPSNFNQMLIHRDSIEILKKRLELLSISDKTDIENISKQIKSKYSFKDKDPIYKRKSLISKIGQEIQVIGLLVKYSNQILNLNTKTALINSIRDYEDGEPLSHHIWINVTLFPDTVLPSENCYVLIRGNVYSYLKKNIETASIKPITIIPIDKQYILNWFKKIKCQK